MTESGAGDATRTSEPARADATRAPEELVADSRLPAPLQRRDRERYQVIGEHGRGGLGRVIRAHDKELGRDIAIKELLQRGATAELRFFREALITARLEHPGIVPVHEAGRWPDGTPFYAMKLVAGRPFKDVIDDARTLEDRLALIPHVIAVADAIAYAHDHKIIHRDLKPANVIIGDFGETVVIDWGLAKDLNDNAIDDPTDAGPYRTPATGGLTAAGSILGTPAYMAPEQLQGLADERSDIYALGGILFHVLTGASPRPDVPTHAPRDLRAIAERAMSVDPAARYADARAFADDLRRFIQHRPIAARRYSLVGRAALGFVRHRTASLVLVASLVAVIAILVASLFRIQGESRRTHQALSTAQAERDRAVLASARALLAQDPTAARDLLDSFEGRQTGEAALLLSTIASQPVADDVVKAKSDPVVETATPDLGHVAYALPDGSVHVVAVDDPSADEVLATQAYEATPIAISASGVLVAFVGVDLDTVVGSSRGEPTRTFKASSAGVPIDLWFHGESVLCRLEGDFAIQCVDVETGKEIFHSELGVSVTDVVYARGAATFAYCGSDGLVRRVAAGHAETLGDCRVTQWSLRYSASGATLGVIVSRGLLRLYSTSSPQDVAMPDGVTDLAVGDRPSVVFKTSKAVTWVDVGMERSEVLPIDARDVSYVGVLSGVERPIVARRNAQIEVFTTEGVRVFRGPASPVSTVHLSDQEPRFLTAAGNEIRRWRLRPTVECERILQAKSAQYHVLQSPDGASLYTESRDGALRIVRLGDGTATTLPAHSDVSVGLAVSSDGRYVATGGFDGKLVVWDSVEQKSRSLHPHTRQVRDVAFVPSTHEVISAGADGLVMSWNLDSDATVELHRHDGEAYRLEVARDGRIVLSTSTDGSVGVFDRITGRLRHARGPTRATVAATIVDQHLVASSLDGRVYRWSFDDLDNPTVLRLAEGAARVLRYLPRSQILVTSWGGTIVTSRPDGRVIDRYPLGGSRVTTIAVTDNERFVAAATDIGTLFLLDLDSASVGTIHAADEYVWWATFDASADALYITDLGGRLAQCSLQHFPMYPVRGYDSSSKDESP